MAESSNNVTVIGPDTHIKGEMSFDNNCKLLGRFEGTIRAKGDLHVAEGATCRAEVHTSNIAIDGTVEGNVTATEKIQLNAKSKMTGDLVAGKLIVSEGATFDGHVSVGPEAIKAATGEAGRGGATGKAQGQGQSQSQGQPQPAGAK